MSVDHAVIHTSQRSRVLGLLSDLDWHTFSELHRVGGIRYGARLLELRRQGYRIEHRTHGEDWKSYRLISLTPGVPMPKRVKVFLPYHDAKRLLDEGVVTAAARGAVREAVGSFKHNEAKL